MNIIPALDLIDGQNVRVSQGDYAKKSQMKRTPEEALEFYEGFESVTRIHVVDLMGALKQEALESNLVKKLAELSSLPLEIGGGLRSLETIVQFCDRGVEYFIYGNRVIFYVTWQTGSKNILHEY